jgi:peptidoglycan hydrolase-like protein with peptidoglycan-binding domain
MAATVGNIKLGQSGSAVSEIQKLLNQNGYSLSSDGVFGNQTQQAVLDYQQKNGLKVDGIVGTQTLSSLWANTPTQQAPASGNQTVDYLTDYGSRPAYQQSQAVNDAANTLAQYEANKPGAYQSQYAEQIQGVLDKIMNREAFSYDFAADPMYQQYADRYQQQGKLAMMDTMGNAAALSGGYGNSYAQSVGQQAYQANLQQLNDVIPELRDAAYGMYRDEGQDMYNRMGLLQGLDSTDYGRHRDTVYDWQTDRDYYAGRYDTLYGQDYGSYRDSVSDWESDRSFGYNAQQDALAQSNWEKEYAQSQSNWEKEYALAAQKASGSSSGSSSKSSGSKEVTYQSLQEKLKDMSLTLDDVEIALDMGIVNSVQANALAKQIEAYTQLYGDVSAPATSATSEPDILSESEFNRSSAMIEKYGTYAKYLAKMKGK